MISIQARLSCPRAANLFYGCLAGMLFFSAGSTAHAQQKPVEVIAFQGGYGIDFFQKAAEEFNKLNPQYKVTVSGNPRAWDVLIPRFAAGTPPDLAWPGWGMNLRPVILDGQVLPWDKYLEQPAHGSSKKWIDTFNPSILKLGQLADHTYVLPFNIDAYGWWYDKTLFDQNGWTAPATFDEFIKLGEKMKDKGIAPLTFQGRYPVYFFDGVYFPWVISLGGIEVYKAAINLEPGAWNNPAFLKVAKIVMDLKHRHFFQGGCIGMNHTESQMEMIVGRAAMIPCGTWFVSEMKALLPPTSEIAFAKTPVFSEGRGDPTAIYVSPDGKGWCLPAKGSNPDGAAAFYRYVSSPEKATQFTEEKGTMTAITPEREVKIPSHLQRPFDAVKNARVTWSNNIADWYTPLETELETAFVDMYNELITPEEFCARLEKASQAYRAQLGKNRIQWD